MPKSSGAKPKKATDEKWYAVLTDGMKYVYRLGLAATRKAPPAQRFAIWAMFAAFALVMAYMAIPPYKERKQEIGLIVGVGFLAVGLVLLELAVLRLPRPTGNGGGVSQAPLSPAFLNGLRATLVNAREAVRNTLQRSYVQVKDKDVRANIFLPMKASGVGGKKTQLGIPAGLCINMDSEAERNVTFEPGKGGTGHAYEFGEPLIIGRDPKGQFGWNARYKIDAEQAAIIDPSLKWIISIPIIVNQKEVVGVMNIDVLNHDLDYDTVSSCCTLAGAFGEMMGRYFARQ